MEGGESVVVPVTRHIVAAIVSALHDNTLHFHLSITLHYHHLPNIILHINVASDLMKTEGPQNATNEVFFPDNSTTTSIVLSWPFLSAAVEIPTEEARHFSIFRRYLHQRYISRNKLRLHSLLAKKTCLSKILASASSQTVKKLDLTWNNKMKVFHVIFIMKRVCLPFSPPPSTSTLTLPPELQLCVRPHFVYDVLSLQRKQQYGGISGLSPRKVHRHTSQ